MRSPGETKLAAKFTLFSRRRHSNLKQPTSTFSLPSNQSENCCSAFPATEEEEKKNQLSILSITTQGLQTKITSYHRDFSPGHLAGHIWATRTRPWRCRRRLRGEEDFRRHGASQMLDIRLQVRSGWESAVGQSWSGAGNSRQARPGRESPENMGVLPFLRILKNEGESITMWSLASKAMPGRSQKSYHQTFEMNKLINQA